MPHGHLIDRANRPQTLLFDHLVGAGEQRLGARPVALAPLVGIEERATRPSVGIS